MYDVCSVWCVSVCVWGGSREWDGVCEICVYVCVVCMWYVCLCVMCVVSVYQYVCVCSSSSSREVGNRMVCV